MTATGNAAQVFHAHGTFSTTDTVCGIPLPEKLQTPNGPVLIRDAGSITLQEVFDLTTGDNISETIVGVNGPHPVAETAFNVSCDVVDATIG